MKLRATKSLLMAFIMGECMYQKTTIAIAVLGCLSTSVMAAPLVFNDPTKSFITDSLTNQGATIKAKDIAITSATGNALTAYGTFDLQSSGDILISGKNNGIFLPTDETNSGSSGLLGK